MLLQVGRMARDAAIVAHLLAQARELEPGAVLPAAPAAPIAELAVAVERLRAGEALFASDRELQRFYREMGGRILARLLLITERALEKVAAQLDAATEVQQIPLARLLKVLDTLAPYVAKVAPPAAAYPTDPEAVEQAVAAARRELADLRGG